MNITKLVGALIIAATKERIQVVYCMKQWVIVIVSFMLWHIFIVQQLTKATETNSIKRLGKIIKKHKKIQV